MCPMNIFGHSKDKRRLLYVSSKTRDVKKICLTRFSIFACMQIKKTHDGTFIYNRLELSRVRLLPLSQLFGYQILLLRISPQKIHAHRAAGAFCHLL